MKRCWNGDRVITGSLVVSEDRCFTACCKPSEHPAWAVVVNCRSHGHENPRCSTSPLFLLCFAARQSLRVP